MKYYFIGESNLRGDKDDPSKQFAKASEAPRYKIFYGARRDELGGKTMIMLEDPKEIEVRKDIIVIDEADVKKDMERTKDTQYLIDAQFDGEEFKKDDIGV